MYPLFSQNSINSYRKHGQHGILPGIEKDTFPVFWCTVLDSNSSQVTSPGRNSIDIVGSDGTKQLHM